MSRHEGEESCSDDHVQEVTQYDATSESFLSLDSGRGVVLKFSAQAFASSCICEIPYVRNRWVRFLCCPQTKQQRKNLGGQSWDLNPGPLGVKREGYLQVMGTVIGWYGLLIEGLGFLSQQHPFFLSWAQRLGLDSSYCQSLYMGRVLDCSVHAHQ